MRSGSEKIRLYCVVFVEERKQLVVWKMDGCVTSGLFIYLCMYVRFWYVSQMNSDKHVLTWKLFLCVEVEIFSHGSNGGAFCRLWKVVFHIWCIASTFIHSYLLL
jgi:hypothetical protein